MQSENCRINDLCALIWQFFVSNGHFNIKNLILWIKNDNQKE